MISFQNIDKRNTRSDDISRILQTWEGGANGVILNTCARLEFYHGDGKVDAAIANHLFRLTAGLESLILGESAIQGQVRRAYMEAGEYIGSSLHQLFQRALFVGRRVRSETGLSRGAISYSQASVELVLENMESEIKDANITLTGAHALNESIIRFLVGKGAKTIFIANRTFIKAQHLADKLSCKAVSFSSLEQVLSETDVLISATAAPHLVIKKERFPKNKKMIVLDLAMPIDVDPEIGKLKDVRLFSLAEIEQQMDQNLGKRMREVIKAEKIVAEEVKRFIEEQKQRVKQSA